MSMAKSKTTKHKYPIAHIGQKPSYLQFQADNSEAQVIPTPGEDDNCSDSSMPPFSPLTSPGHRLVDSSAGESLDTQSAVMVERVYKTPWWEAAENHPIPLNAKGHPMIAVKRPRKTFPTKQMTGKQCSDDRKVVMPLKLGKYRPCQLALQEIRRYQ